MKRAKIYKINKKENNAVNRIFSKLNGFFTSTLKLTIVLTLFFIAALMISGAGIIVEDGALNVSNNLLVNSNTLFANSANNRVGIGTASPNTTLHISKSTAGTSIEILRLDAYGNAAAGRGPYITFYGPNNTGSSRLNAQIEGVSDVNGLNNGGRLMFRTTDSSDVIQERMRIDRSGRVGIGTTSPKATLNVVGDVYHNLSTVSQDFNIVNATGNSRLFVDNSKGYIGIATTAPNATFTVASGKTTIADEWTVRSDRDIKTEITNYDYIDILNHPLTIYRYKYKYQEPIYNIDEITGERTIIGYENKISREHIGIMADEAPQELLGADGQGIDIYAFASYVYDYAKKVKAENDALKQALCLEFPENELCK